MLLQLSITYRWLRCKCVKRSLKRPDATIYEYWYLGPVASHMTKSFLCGQSKFFWGKLMHIPSLMIWFLSSLGNQTKVVEEIKINRQITPQGLAYCSLFTFSVEPQMQLLPRFYLYLSWDKSCLCCINIIIVQLYTILS